MKSLTAYGRLAFLVIAIAMIGVGTFFASAHLPRAHAAELLPPSKLRDVDRIAMHKAWSHEQDEMKKAQEALKKLVAEDERVIDAIAATYHFDLKTARIDFVTGEITRASAKTAQADPPPKKK